MASSRKNMNIFTESRRDIHPRDWKKEILDSIITTGTVDSNVNIVVASRDNSRQILDFNSGVPRINKSVINKFSLIVNKPFISEDKVHCCLCNRVISFSDKPVWYYSIKYAVNHFHYFICFDSSSSDKPSTKCYRRE